MFAVGMKRGKSGVHRFELPMPQIKQPDEVLIRIKEVGLDGTDYNIVKYGPEIVENRNEIVMGHEVVGVVESIGERVGSLVPGDIVCVTVRRGCGICQPCLRNQSDMCMTGLYTERGIYKLDGFLTEFAVDKEQYIVKVPAELKGMAVLTEPLSIAEKGIEQIRLIQSRLPWTCPHPDHAFSSSNWGGCKTALVVGAGPLGLLATALLRLANVNTIVADIVPEEHPKASLVDYLGAKYEDVRGRTAKEIAEYCSNSSGSLDIIFEASGAASIALELVNYMARSSVYIMTGIPHEALLLQIDAAKILRQLVSNNQVIVGSVNSNRIHFENALKDMAKMKSMFSKLFEKIITERFRLDEYEKAFAPKKPGHVKTTILVEPWN